MIDKKIETARKMLMDYIREHCAEQGITQDVLAERTGMTRTNVNRLLAGRYPPSLDNFIKLAEASNCYIFMIEKKANDDLCKMMRDRWKRTGEKN